MQTVRITMQQYTFNITCRIVSDDTQPLPVLGSENSGTR